MATDDFLCCLIGHKSVVELASFFQKGRVNLEEIDTHTLRKCQQQFGVQRSHCKNFIDIAPVARQLLRQPCYCSSLALERLANYVTNVWWKFRMIRHKKGANRFTHLRNQGIAKRHLQINKQQQPTPTWAWNFVYRFILL